MIELLLEDRCTQCNACVKICPAAVFELQAHGPPKIARADDCHTCFMCELYCRADALFVAPNWDRRLGLDRQDAIVRGTLGQYRRHSGWDEWKEIYPNEQWLMETVFQRAAARNTTSTDKAAAERPQSLEASSHRRVED